MDTDLDGIADGGDAFPCDWRRTAVTFVPGEFDYATLLFEDNWPAQGDLDFNDAVLLHNVAVFHDASGRASGLRLTLLPRAIGANILSGVALRLPVPASAVGSIVRTVDGQSPTALTVLPSETDLVVPVVSSLRDLFSGAAGFINTERSVASLGDGGLVTVELWFTQPVELSLASDPFDLYFFRTEDPRHQIHRPQFAGTDTMNEALFGTADDGSSGIRFFIDRDGLPFVLSVPQQSVWPVERESVERLWPELGAFAASGGTEAQDFYANNIDLSKAYPAPVAVQALGLDFGQCVAASCTDGARNGVETDVDCGGGCGGCGVGAACRGHEDCAGGVCAASACVQADERDCTLANGTGVETRAPNGWAACQATACDANYHVEAGACAPDTRACVITHGTGTQTWSGASFTPCTLEGCDAGYRASGDACVLVTYAWNAGSFGACSGGSASPSYGAWGSCSGGSGSWSTGAFGACSASAVCSGAGSQSRTVSCDITPSSGTQSRSGTCDWVASSGSQSRAVSCVNNFGETVAGALCSGSAPSATQACTPTGAASCGALVTSQACTPTGSSVCTGSAPSATRSCSSPAGSRSCTITNGSGSQSCAAGASAWGSCAPASCSTGYVSNGTACVLSSAVVSSVTQVSSSGEGDRDGNAFPASNMFDGNTSSRARFRTGGSPGYIVTITLTAPITLSGIRTFVPQGSNAGYAGIRISTDSGSGTFTTRYTNLNLFALSGRFAYATYLGGGSWGANVQGAQGNVDHTFTAVSGVTRIRLEFGYNDEASDSCYSINEVTFL